MPMQAKIIVQPYGKGPKGRFVPGTQKEAPTAEAAMAFAQRLVDALESVVGADVVRIEADADAGDYSEPEFLARIGTVPDIE